MLNRRLFSLAALATPFVWGATRSWAQDLGAMRQEGDALAKRIAPRTGEPFATGSEEVVVFLVGIADLAFGPSPQEAPTARALAHLELVVDVVAASVAGEIYGFVPEAGDIGGLEGATIRVDGHMTEVEGGGYGVWLEAPNRSVGRPTQGTRLGIKGNFDLRGSAAPRLAYGPLAGTFSLGSSGRQAAFGAAALWEVQKI